jgi:hypothetical protein
MRMPVGAQSAHLGRTRLESYAFAWLSLVT